MDKPITKQTQSETYTLAFEDNNFLRDEDLRPLRFQLEMMKPQRAIDAQGIETTIAFFGGARVPAPHHLENAGPALREISHFYNEARLLAQKITNLSKISGYREDVVVTGGGPGIMEAANLGAAEVGGKSIGFNITLPHEQAPNEYITPELCFNFHYFSLRKFHFLLKARAVVVFPGGLGTLDELFEVLTLMQTKKMPRIPVVLFGKDFWTKVINWQALVEAQTISEDDLGLFEFVETADEALNILYR